MPGLLGLVLGSKLGLVGLIAASGVWLNDIHPGFALSKQFAGPAFVLALVGAVLAKAAGRARTLTAFLAAAALLLAPLGRQWLPSAPAAEAGARPVRIYFANLWVKNDRLNDAARSIAKAKPDVVALVEATPPRRGSRGVLEDYPYVVSERGGGPSTNVIASRWPLEGIRNRTEDGLAVVEARVRAPGRRFRLVVVHLTRPWPFTDVQAQRSQLDRLVRRLREDGEPERTVVVGDFNATLSGDLLQQFQEDAALTPAAARVGTWPAVLPGVLRLGIDNVFVSHDLTVVNKRVGEPNGSDHRPLVFEVAPSARRPNRDDDGNRRFQAGF